MTTPGFANPIAGGGILVQPGVQSPNFSIAGQTGWAIFANGSAYFFNVTASGIITATAFAGTDFVINSAGEFFYSGAPALGNLVAAIAPAAGGTDAHGNVYPPGTNFGVWSAGGVLQQHFGIDANGNTYLANNSGLTVVFGKVLDGAMLFYNSSGQGAGNLNVSIAPIAGSDSGNSYVAGIEVQNGGRILTKGTSASIVELISGGNPVKEWLSGSAHEVATSPARITTNVQNIGGANETIVWILDGPAVTGETDFVIVETRSAANDGSNNPFGTLGYVDTGGTPHARLVWDSTGVRVFNSLDSNTYRAGRLTLATTGAQTINSTGANIITGLSCNMGIGTYHIRGKVTYVGNQAAGTPTLLLAGQAFSGNVNWTSSFTTLAGVATQPIKNFLRGGSGYPNNAGPVLVNGGFVDYEFDGVVTTTTAGGFSVQAATSVAVDTFTIQQGSYCEVFPVNA